MESAFAGSRTLWSRLVVTLAVIVVYRLGVWIPLPGIDHEHLRLFFQTLDWWHFFTGVTERFSVFALGLIPYLNAAILFSLIAFRSVRLRELFLAQDAQFSWSLWALVLLFSLLQAIGTSVVIVTQGLTLWAPWAFYLVNVPVLTAGVFVLIWLGGLINRYGIGHGWAILIAVGILSDWPRYFATIAYELQAKTASWAWGLGLFALFMFVLVGSIWALRSTRQLEGAGRTAPFLHVGIIPMELSAWALSIVALGLSGLAGREAMLSPTWLQALQTDLAQGGWGYIVTLGVLVLLFTYFYKNAILHPQALGVASNPALGASLFLIIIALLPLVVTQLSGLTGYFFGGTGLLILVGVLLDTLRRAKMELPLVGVYRTFSHAQAHEARARLESAGIASALQTPVPYSYNLYPMLGPVEIAVSERDRARAEEIVRSTGPEAALRVPPREGVLWAVLVGVALVVLLIRIGFQISVWPDVATPTALALVLVGVGLFGWLCQSYREYAYWFLMIVLWLVALAYMTVQVPYFQNP
ncbi:MAG: DUF2007 domain-containing protein [Candidatus Bipolaricaulota bacterium]|nr:DUF2007 domain-containing protein [Candidatus Bipolaricaulota bacterium]MDW8141050.1 DUF2007 domain-containing protein [Candidatus Bipolaricaulota bacterium]